MTIETPSVELVPVDSLLTKREAAARLRASIATVERAIRARKLRAVRLVGSTRIRESDLAAFLAALPAVQYRAHRAAEAVAA